MISLVQHGLPDVLELLRSPAGALLFMPLYALWVTLLLPGVWASMLAGVLYGTWLGSGLVFVGACLGAVVVFLLGRSVLRDWAQRRLQQFPKLQAVERAVSKEDGRVVLTRLTAKGKRLATKAAGPRIDAAGEVASALSRSEKKQLNALLGKLLESLDPGGASDI